MPMRALGAASAGPVIRNTSSEKDCSFMKSFSKIVIITSFSAVSPDACRVLYYKLNIFQVLPGPTCKKCVCHYKI